MAFQPERVYFLQPHPAATQATTLLSDILFATNLLSYLVAGGAASPAALPETLLTTLFTPPARYTHLSKRPSQPVIVRRPITSTTYARRLFVTEPLAILFGFDWPSVQACRLTGTKLPAFVVDVNGRKWNAKFEPRTSKTLTGQLGGGWSAFASAHGLRVGDVVKFWRGEGEWAGEYGVRARVVKSEHGSVCGLGAA